MFYPCRIYVRFIATRTQNQATFAHFVVQRSALHGWKPLAFQDMDSQSRLTALKEIAGKLSINIEYYKLTDDNVTIQSGYCLVNKKPYIILDQNLPAEQQVGIILESLKRFDLESIYLPPWIRESLEPYPKQNS